jgi:hypothetical protein
MKDVEIAYLAGLIDGDGTISIHSDSGAHKPMVSIANTNREVLEWCKNLIGKGSISNKKTYKSHHTPSFNLRWEYDIALDVAKKCYPYLIIKKERAGCVLKWKSVVKRNGKYTLKELCRKNELIEEIRKLNKR